MPPGALKVNTINAKSTGKRLSNAGWRIEKKREPYFLQCFSSFKDEINHVDLW